MDIMVKIVSNMVKIVSNMVKIVSTINSRRKQRRILAYLKLTDACSLIQMSVFVELYNLYTVAYWGALGHALVGSCPHLANVLICVCI